MWLAHAESVNAIDRLAEMVIPIREVATEASSALKQLSATPAEVV